MQQITNTDIKKHVRIPQSYNTDKIQDEYLITILVDSHQLCQIYKECGTLLDFFFFQYPNQVQLEEISFI